MDSGMGSDYIDRRNKKRDWQQSSKKRNNQKEERIRDGKIQNRLLQREMAENPREAQQIREEYEAVNNAHLQRMKKREEHKKPVGKKNTHQNGSGPSATPAAKAPNQAYLSFLMKSFKEP